MVATRGFKETPPSCIKTSRSCLFSNPRTSDLLLSYCRLLSSHEKSRSTIMQRSERGNESVLSVGVGAPKDGSSLKVSGHGSYEFHRR